MTTETVGNSTLTTVRGIEHRPLDTLIINTPARLILADDEIEGILWHTSRMGMVTGSGLNRLLRIDTRIFDGNILDRLGGSDPSVTDYVLEVPIVAGGQDLYHTNVPRKAYIGRIQ